MRVFSGQHLTARRDTDGAIVVCWDTPNSPFNQPDENLVVEWNLLMDKLEELPRLPLVVLSSGKKGVFGRGWAASALNSQGAAGRMAPKTEGWDAILNRWEMLPCPTLATVAGTCMDEALDIALACDYRVAYQSGSALLGWTSVFRGWCPPPSTLRRLLGQLGIEGFARLLILGQTLNAQEARRWGLVDCAAQGEAGLRDAIGRMKRMAFLRGKPLRREMVSWRGKWGNKLAFCRNWIRRGMKRVLDRTVSFEHPLVAHAWGTVERSIGSPEWRDPDAWEAVARLGLDPGGQWIRAARCAATPPGAPTTSSPFNRVFLVGDSELEVEIARRALTENMPVHVGAENAENLGRRVMRLGTWARVPASSALKLIHGKVFAELARDRITSSDLVLGEPNWAWADWASWSGPGMRLIANQDNAMNEGQVGVYCLTGKHRIGWIELSRPESQATQLLEATGFRVSPGKIQPSMWRVAGAWWAETLRALAEGLDPFAIEQEARKFGFLKGPLADLFENSRNIPWMTTLVCQDDARILGLWHEMFGAKSQKSSGNQPVMGWWQARRWRYMAKASLSPLLSAMPASARLAALGMRWIGAIILACEGEETRTATGLVSLEARVGWPVFRGPPQAAMDIRGETLVSLGNRLASTFGERFVALAEGFSQDKA